MATTKIPEHFVPLTYQICHRQTFVRMTEEPDKHENCRYFTGKLDSTLVTEFIDNYLLPKCLYLKQHHPDQADLILDLVQKIQQSPNSHINSFLSSNIQTLMEKVYDDDVPLITEQHVQANDNPYQHIINEYFDYQSKIEKIKQSADPFASPDPRAHSYIKM